jgi:3-hydroxyisobutyrate dehydrogenase
MSKRIAFIGLGNMGAGMAANQAKTGATVAAFDLSADALKHAAEVGCTPATTAAEAVAGADIVITMLPAGVHVRKVYADAVWDNVKPGAILIDCSTTDVDTPRDIAAEAKKRGFRFADAPVSGGQTGAEAGQLAFMVGCAEADFADIDAVLQPMAKAVIRAGDPGAGQAAKICNNMVLGVSMIAVCEAFALAEKLGLDPERFFEISSKSSGQCWSLTTYSPWPGLVPTAPSNRDYQGGFATAMMLKDLKLAQEAAARAGASTPMGGMAESLYALLNTQGAGGRDFSVMLEWLRGKEV